MKNFLTSSEDSHILLMLKENIFFLKRIDTNGAQRVCQRQFIDSKSLNYLSLAILKGNIITWQKQLN